MIDENQMSFHFDNLYWSNPQDYELITLYQVGDLCSKEGFDLEYHTQICYEISYVVSGKGWFATNGKKYPVQQGDLYINAPGEHHSGKADAKNPFRFFYLGFNFNTYPHMQNALIHIEKMLQKVDVPCTRDCLDIDIPFRQVLKEINQVNEYSQLMIKILLQQILVYTYRNFCSSWEQKYVPNPEKPQGDTIYQIINYIDSKLLSLTGLADIGHELGYSYPYLSRVFSEETGFTLQEYYTRKRMEKAIQWLQSNEYNITEIAYRLGYQTIQSFSKAFKKTIGVSPNQYRQFHKQKKRESD